MRLSSPLLLSLALFSLLLVGVAGLGCSGFGPQEPPSYAGGEPPAPTPDLRARDEAPSPGVKLMTGDAEEERKLEDAAAE